MTKKILAKLLEIKSTYLREYMIRALLHAGSGHTGGSSSSLDILNTLYNGGILAHDPKNPAWPERDRVIVTGHRAPAVSAILAEAGYLGKNGLKLYLNTYRDFGSPFQGHLSRLWMAGVEASTGSLGQIISVGAGMAYGLKVNAYGDSPHSGTVPSNKVYVLVGDGELQEGQNWEALMSAAKYRLGNLCLIVDRNRMQIDGLTRNIMPLEPLKDKFKAFGLRVKEVTLHSGTVSGKINYLGLLNLFENFKKYRGNKPLVIIAHTLKAYGIPGMAGKVDSHGVAPREENAREAIKNLKIFRAKLEKEYFKEYRKYIWFPYKGKTKKPGKIKKQIKINLKASEFKNFIPGAEIATRDAYGRVLEYLARTKNVDLIALEADLAKSTRGDWLDRVKNFDRARHIELGIAEANMVGWAAGLASCLGRKNKKRVILASSFAVFIPGRCYDQLRNTVAYSGFDCNFIGTHGGLSVGEDGGSHQGLEDIALARVIPGMRVFSCSDAISAVKAIEAAINYNGPAYVRLARPKTEIIYNKKRAPDPYKAQVFASGKLDKVSIMATGPILAEALEAQKSLAMKKIKVRVYDFISLKPIDEKAIKEAASFGPIITIEDHSVIGGLGEAVAGIVTERAKPTRIIKLGVQDKFGQTGKPEELLSAYGLRVRDIVRKACQLLK